MVREGGGGERREFTLCERRNIYVDRGTSPPFLFVYKKDKIVCTNTHKNTHILFICSDFYREVKEKMRYAHIYIYICMQSGQKYTLVCHECMYAFT